MIENWLDTNEIPTGSIVYDILTAIKFGGGNPAGGPTPETILRSARGRVKAILHLKCKGKLNAIAKVVEPRTKLMEVIKTLPDPNDAHKSAASQFCHLVKEHCTEMVALSQGLRPLLTAAEAFLLRRHCYEPEEQDMDAVELTIRGMKLAVETFHPGLAHAGTKALSFVYTYLRTVVDAYGVSREKIVVEKH